MDRCRSGCRCRSSCSNHASRLRSFRWHEARPLRTPDATARLPLEVLDQSVVNVDGAGGRPDLCGPEVVGAAAGADAGDPLGRGIPLHTSMPDTSGADQSPHARILAEVVIAEAGVDPVDGHGGQEVPGEDGSAWIMLRVRAQPHHRPRCGALNDAPPRSSRTVASGAITSAAPTATTPSGASPWPPGPHGRRADTPRPSALPPGSGRRRPPALDSELPALLMLGPPHRSTGPALHR
jgi:hypothetical protein